MLAEYEKVGLISLHRRAASSRIMVAPNNYFELGTLNDQSLDKQIKQRFKRAMRRKGVLFDDNERFVGGKSIRRIHKKYNDPGYQHCSDNGHDPSANVVQIAQLEINGLRRPDVSLHCDCVGKLAKNMLAHF